MEGELSKGAMHFDAPWVCLVLTWGWDGIWVSCHLDLVDDEQSEADQMGRIAKGAELMVPPWV
jgi:hypothetical protein